MNRTGVPNKLLQRMADLSEGDNLSHGGTGGGSNFLNERNYITLASSYYFSALNQLLIVLINNHVSNNKYSPYTEVRNRRD